MTPQAVQNLYIDLSIDAESYNVHKSYWLHHKTSYDVIQLIYWQKPTQILKRFRNTSKLENFPLS